jgi:hypothetical protein
MSKDTQITQLLRRHESHNSQLNLQECIDLLNFLTEESRTLHGSRKRHPSPISQESAFFRRWGTNINSHYANEKIIHREEEFIKHSIFLIRSLNQGTENKSHQLEQILSQNNHLFPKAVEILLSHRSSKASLPELRNFFEAGAPRIGFLWLWNVYQNLEGRTLNQPLIAKIRPFFNETGAWKYHQDNSELVFEPFKIARPYRRSPGVYLDSFDKFPILPTDSYSPWLWLLSWQQETMGVKARLGLIDQMIDFLNQLHQAGVFSKPGRMLYYFVLSKLHLHAQKTGGPDPETAQKFVDNIAAEHPLGLFDPKLPAPVLKHCAEMQLQRYQTLLVSPPTNVWQPEFLQAVPRILPALHALLHWRNPAETSLTGKDTFDDKLEIDSIPEKHLKSILQKFNPALFADQKLATLPQKDSSQGQVCFTLLPRLIEYFMEADKVLKDQLHSLAIQNQAANILLETMQATLQQYRQQLAELFCNEIRSLLSLNPKEKISLQDQEILIKRKILAHALNWPVAILQQEENRLMQRLEATPGKPSPPHLTTPPEIKALQKGREEITDLTQWCLEGKVKPDVYTESVQHVLTEVEQTAGAHTSFLSVVARVAANIVIFLSAGLLHSFFKKQIQETRAAPTTKFNQYFFSLNSRRAETIHCANAAVSYGIGKQ